MKPSTLVAMKTEHCGRSRVLDIDPPALLVAVERRGKYALKKRTLREGGQLGGTRSRHGLEERARPFDVRLRPRLEGSRLRLERRCEPGSSLSLPQLDCTEPPAIARRLIAGR